MKTLIITITLFFLGSINNLKSQEVIMSKQHLDKISKIQDRFYNKPLKDFLKDLKIDIASVSYQKECESNPDQIILRFDDRLKYNRMRRDNILPARIIIQFLPEKETKNIFQNLNKAFIDKIQDIKIFMIFG